MSKASEIQEAMQALAAEMEFDEDSPKVKTPAQLWDAGWRPSYNPIQKKAARSKSIYTLMYGERGSGKSMGAGIRLVEFLFLNRDSLGFLVVREIGMATEGGLWDKLSRDILPK